MKFKPPRWRDLVLFRTKSLRPELMLSYRIFLKFDELTISYYAQYLSVQFPSDRRARPPRRKVMKER